jgi:hypothetical protein
MINIKPIRLDRFFLLPELVNLLYFIQVNNGVVMKKIIIAFVVLMMGLSLNADTPITSFKAMVWNGFINNLVEIKVNIFYQEDTETIYMAIPDAKFPMQITMTEEYRSKMYSMIKRFQRKYRNAIDWNEKLDLELGVLPTAESSFKRHKTWHKSNVNSSANFFSQSHELHQFILFFSPMPSQIDKDITREGFKLYFWSDDIKQLEQAFHPREYKKYQKNSEE